MKFKQALQRVRFLYVLATIALLAFIYFGYQIIVVQPQQKAEAVTQAKDAAQHDLQTCLEKARSEYGLEHGAQCEITYGSYAKNYEYCLDLGKDASYCASIYGDYSNGASVCTLPLDKENRLNQNYDSDKDNCYKAYSATQ